MKSLSALALTFLVSITVSLISPTSSQASIAPADLDALKQLFEKDPATAFEKSWKLFQEPRKKGDPEAMMEIIRAVAPEARRASSNHRRASLKP